MIVMNEKKKEAIKKEIKSHFNRSQSWLAEQINMSETMLSRKINGRKEWTQDDFDKINVILGTNFKI